MKPSSRAIALSTCFFLVSGCATPNVVAEAVRPDLTNPERFQCEAIQPGSRPSIPAEDVIDLDRAAQARSVEMALTIVREEVAAYVASVRAREGVVSRYVILVEGRLFDCANNMAWQRDFYRGLPAPKGGT